MKAAPEGMKMASVTAVLFAHVLMLSRMVGNCLPSSGA
jgi:hypothetical protein